MGINELILEGSALEEISNKTELEDKFDIWCSKIRVYMKENDFSDAEQEEAKVKMHYTKNEYSENDTKASLKKAIKDTLLFFEEKVCVSEKESFKQIELSLIERILNNFYMYYRSMYKNPIHKKGTLTQETLMGFQIGNEYDLQRMLYSILCPLFPDIRQEVYSDNGYGGMRADIYLETYDLIIEIKCTRGSMSEKKLTEELGADGFYYNADNIYFFVCDKANIIKNPEAFKMALERDLKTDGKTVKTFIMQAIEF